MPWPPPPNGAQGSQGCSWDLNFTSQNIGFGQWGVRGTYRRRPQGRLPACVVLLDSSCHPLQGGVGGQKWRGDSENRRKLIDLIWRRQKSHMGSKCPVAVCQIRSKVFDLRTRFPKKTQNNFRMLCSKQASLEPLWPFDAHRKLQRSLP